MFTRVSYLICIDNTYSMKNNNGGINGLEKGEEPIKRPFGKYFEILVGFFDKRRNNML
jgi:hypothetical protein